MAQLPDGLIFEYEIDHKGVNLTAIQRELIKCKHCAYAALKMNVDYKPTLYCKMYNDYIVEEHFCAYAEKIENDF